MDVYEALYTTRAMRRMRPDPIPDEIQARILDAAIRAPSGTNMQAWRFMLVDDPQVKGELGSIYRMCYAELYENYLAGRVVAAEAVPDDPENAGFLRVMRSSNYLAKHFEHAPLFLFGFVQVDTTGIRMALWSAMLAARAEGVGSAFTSILSFQTEQVMKVLGVPGDQGWEMGGCVVLGYPLGRWGIAPRRPVHEVATRNTWDGALGFEVAEPLWPRPHGSGTVTAN